MNEQWDIAAEMLGVKDSDFFSGVVNCEFSFEQLSGLINLGIIRLEHKFNNSPAVEIFYEFGKRAAVCGAMVVYIGFLESKLRDNARLVIEGVKVTKFFDSSCLILDFAQTFHGADEFTANAELLRAWYD